MRLRTRYRLLALAVVLVGAYSASIGQTFTVGPSFRVILESANFKSVPGYTSCCPEYTSTIGTGFGISGAYEHWLSDDLTLRGGLMFGLEGSTFSQTESALIDGGGTAVNGTFLHETATSHMWLGLEPMLLWGGREEGLRLGGGLRFGYLFPISFEQESRISSPDNVRFENDSRTRDAASGEIPDQSSIDLSVIARAGWMLLATETFRIEPYLALEAGLIPVQSDMSWSRYGARVGVSFGFLPGEEHKEPQIQDLDQYEEPVVARSIETEIPADTAVMLAIPPDPEVKITIAAVDNRGETVTPDTIRFQNVLSRVMAPILPYVFHESSLAIPSHNYTTLSSNEASAFDVKQLAKSAGIMEMHYQTLNVIGFRMRQVRDADLTIIGNSSGGGPEGQDVQLAEQRAQWVKNYLVSVWGIDAGRITASNRGVPEAPSNLETEEGLAENSRTEFMSSRPEILEPFLIQDTVLHADLALMKILPSLTAQSEIESWRVVTTQGNTELSRFEGQGAMPEQGLTWNLVDERSLDLVDGVPIVVDASIRLKSGEVKWAVKKLPVTVDFDVRDRVEQYNLIVFGYNSAELTPDHERIIGKVKDMLGEGVDIKIIGYADKTGSAEQNLSLSTRRAQAVARAIGVPESSAYGVGSSELLFDNDSPEGRFFCRTVRIFVRSAIE